MNGEHFQGLSDSLRLALRTNQRLSIDQFYELLGFAEAIIDLGRRFQSDEKWPISPPSDILVGIPELADLFGEKPNIVKDALLLLRGMGRASPGPYQVWSLKLTDVTRTNRKKAGAR